MFFLIFSFLMSAQPETLSPKEMSFLSEAVAKSLVSCEKIRGATLFGDLEFRNGGNVAVSQRAFSAQIKQQLKKNMGVRFQGSNKKNTIKARATLTSSKSLDSGKKIISYELKINFSENGEFLCEAQNEMTKTF